MEVIKKATSLKFIEMNKPYIAMIIIQFVYAAMSLLSKAAVTEGMNPYIFVVYRQVFAMIALASCAFFFERSNSVSLSFVLLCKIFLISLFGITMALNLYYFALNYVSATFATAFTNTIPAITFIFAVCLRIENISILQSHGMAKVMGSTVSLSGALIFTFVKGPPIFPRMKNKNSGHDLTKRCPGADWIKGSVILLFANITWSLWLIMQGLIIKQYPSKLRLTTLQIFFSCIISAIWAVFNERSIASWRLGWNLNLLSVVYCGLIVTAISYWLQLWVVEKKGPVFTAMFSPLALLITAIFSALLFKENFHWGSFCGAMLLVIGLYFFLWGKNKEDKIEISEKEEGKIERSEKEEGKIGRSEKEEVKGEKTLQGITCQ